MSAIHAKVAIGVDLGGTNIRAAIVTASGEIAAQQHIPTPQQAGQLAPPPLLIEAISACVAPLLQHDNIIGIGIGSGGQFNPHTGMMLGIHSDQPAFVNVPFATHLQEKLAYPVFVDNDVKAAALAELQCGAGRGYQHILCVAVGTFIGGALILNGQLVHGATGLAGHLGQLVDFQTGTFIEDIAGGVPLAQRALHAGLLQPDETASDLFQKARNGNDDARQFITQTGQMLGFALAGITHFLQPEVILVGGSVGLQPEYLIAINQGLQAKLMTNWQSVVALPMQLGTNAGQIGAGLRVFAELA